jgi:valyl-tRNA synthetase
MILSTKYDPSEIEDKWYKAWLDKELFKSVPDGREPYCIVIPPPNVTGVLHMGHMLNNTIQDVMVRRARMMGKNACWVPGTDHASIATEAKVVAMLKEKGLSKAGIGRDKFLEYAFEWKEKYGGIILDQLQKLGCSCDWSRTRFTMEESLSEAVIDVFIQLHQEGLIYRGARMVNWDPEGKTALSDEEVLYKETDAFLYYIKYQIEGSEEFISIATTRPETLLGDTAVCVNPSDDRYKHLVGKKCLVPLVNRLVPIIRDDYVEADFGTGALKVTPAHDINDYELGVRHHLPTIDVFNEDGTMSDAAGMFIGEDRFATRKKVIALLEENGQLYKKEAIKHKIGISERTHAVIEPRISSQWFVDMSEFMKQNPEVLDSVMSDEVNLYPAKYKNTYKHWIDNIKDWCISRQLWWGHRIPAWYLPDGTYVVAKTVDEALIEAQKKDSGISMTDLKQDEDVLDTWFSSWLWPISIFDGFKESGQKDFNYYYPTSDLVTGPDIIFFWVARMVMAGYHFKGKKPFNNVYFTGIVRDKQRRKMSKQLGNSPDPIELMQKYGTDGVRMGLLLSAPAGNDLLFDEAHCEQGRNFCNKIWNAYRLLQSLETSDQFINQSTHQLINQWMQAKINEAINAVDDHMSKYRISDALMTIYKLVWDDYCSWYLEMIKPAFGEKIYEPVLVQAKKFMEQLLLMLHPFTPFISEELWQNLSIAEGKRFINQQKWPEKIPTSIKPDEFDPALQLIGQIRALRNENGISPKVAASVGITAKDHKPFENLKPMIQKLANVSEMRFSHIGKGFNILVGTDEAQIFFAGFEPTKVDMESLQKEITRLEQFLVNIDLKLSNEKFVNNAQPELVERERRKRNDTETKLKTLRSEMAS